MMSPNQPSPEELFADIKLNAVLFLSAIAVIRILPYALEALPSIGKYVQ
jgi:hypothetical protein